MQITDEQRDALQELLNIGVGKAAGALNQMLEKPIRLHIPSICIGPIQELQTAIDTDAAEFHASVRLPFHGAFSGSTCLLFPTQSAASLLTVLTGETQNQDSWDSMKEATLTEIGNIVLNGVMGSLTNVLQHCITYSVPFYEETTIQQLIQPKATQTPEMMLWAQTRFTIEDYNISGDIILLMGVQDLGCLLQAITALLQTADSCHGPTGTR